MAQNIVITDTIKPTLTSVNVKPDQLFSVEGEALGIDSGSIKISSANQELLAYVPFQKGKFYFSGYVKSLEQIHFSIKGDYYDYVLYVEPGQIKIKLAYHGKFTASGTVENDLSNYFGDTLNNKNNERFWELSNRIDLALQTGNLDLYLNLIDSFATVENDFFKTVNDAISQKKIGDYLLAYVNYYYINYGHFAERKAIYDQLPDNLKNSVSGRRALAFLIETQKKNTPHINEQAYQFALKDVNNNLLDLKKFKGKIIVLDFWASWCIPCIKALPLLKKIQAHQVSKDVVYISVSIDKKEADWKAKEEQIHIPWYSLLADELTIKHYDINAVPNYIVLNKKGKIASAGSSLATIYTTLKELNN